MNYLNVFLNPRKAVKDAFAESNPTIVVALNLVHVLVFTVLVFLVGLGLNLAISVLSFIYSLILTLIFTLIVYLVAEKAIKVVKPKTELKDKFFGIAQAFSLVFIFMLVLNVFFITPFFIIPGINQPLQDRAKGIITDEELLVQLDGVIQSQSSLFLNIFVLILLVVFAVLILYMLYLVYLVFSELFQLGFLRNLGLMIAVLAVLFIILFFKSFFF